MDLETVQSVMEARANDYPFSIVTTEYTIVDACNDLCNIKMLTKLYKQLKEPNTQIPDASQTTILNVQAEIHSQQPKQEELK